MSFFCILLLLWGPVKKLPRAMWRNCWNIRKDSSQNIFQWLGPLIYDCFLTGPPFIVGKILPPEVDVTAKDGYSNWKTALIFYQQVRNGPSYVSLSPPHASDLSPPHVSITWQCYLFWPERKHIAGKQGCNTLSGNFIICIPSTHTHNHTHQTPHTENHGDFFYDISTRRAWRPGCDDYSSRKGGGVF